MSALYRAKAFVRHFLTAGNAHSIHSPFVFDLYRNILIRKPCGDFSEIEKIRQELKQDSRIVEVEDFGAGRNKNGKRKVKDIARRSLKSEKQAKLLYNLVEFFQPSTIVELGTSLGITTLYLSHAYSKSTVYTFEGCGKTLSIALEKFKMTSTGNINPIKGNLDYTLKNFTDRGDKVNFVYLDANHRYSPTINYFTTLLQNANEDSVFIFDDIYWSPEMTKAWEEIKGHPSVTISIDLYYIGLIFFRKNAPKQHFRLRV